MKKKVKETTLELMEGDITAMDVDAIVNAANSHLQHGGGVAGAISRKGGPAIQEESDLWIKVRGEVPVGSTAITSGGDLPARYVIHAVGPRMGEGDEDAKLARATLNSLKTAQKHCLKSMAFPAISTGIFGVPMDRCAKIMLETVRAFARKNRDIERVIFCLFGQEALGVFKKCF